VHKKIIQIANVKRYDVNIYIELFESVNRNNLTYSYLIGLWYDILIYLMIKLRVIIDIFSGIITRIYIYCFYITRLVRCAFAETLPSIRLDIIKIRTIHIVTIMMIWTEGIMLCNIVWLIFTKFLSSICYRRNVLNFVMKNCVMKIRFNDKQ